MGKKGKDRLYGGFLFFKCNIKPSAKKKCPFCKKEQVKKWKKVVDKWIFRRYNELDRQPVPKNYWK